MFGLLWTLSTALRRYLRLYLPSNRAVDRLRTPQGFNLAIPAALIVTPAYLFAATVCATVVDRGGPGYLNALVLLFFWNAAKFAVMGALIPIKGKANRRRESRSGGFASLQVTRERRLPDPDRCPREVHRRSVGSSGGRVTRKGMAER
jgi:hypothetical protein